MAKPAAGAVAPQPVRHRAWSRIATHTLTIVAAVVVLLGLAGVVLAHSFDPDAYRPRIEAAVLRATGRTLTIGGALRIGLFNGPRLKATDVRLSNLPDGSRPEMIRVAEVKARLSFGALLTGHIEISRLELVQPDLILEITPSGAPNWRFMPQHAPNVAPATPSGPSRPPARIAVDELRITDGIALLADDRSGRRLTLQLNSVLADIAPEGDRATVAMVASAVGTELRLNAVLGPSAPDAAAAAAGPRWPVKLNLSLLGAQVALTGTVDAGLLPGGHNQPGPSAGRYDLSLIANLQDLTNLSPLLPGVTLPAVKDLHLRLGLAGARGERPTLRQLDVSAGRSDLGTVAPGLLLEQLSIVDAAADRPLQARASGSYAGAAFALAGDFGAPAALQDGNQPYPIALSAAAAGARLTAKGGILHPASLRGLDLALEARVPELAAFAPLLHRALPPLQDLAVQAQISDGADGIRHGVTLQRLHLSTQGNDLAGDLRLAWAPRRALAGQITAARLNAGDLASAFANRVNPPLVPPSPLAVPAAAPPAPAAPGPRHVIPDRPIRFDRWMGTDVDLRLAARSVSWPDEVWRDVGGHLLIADRRLRLESGVAELPAGHAEATVDVDAAAPMPVLSLKLRAPGVSVQPLLALLNLPAAASGRLEVDASLHATGHSPHELAAGADGTLGLAMVGGSVDGSAAQAWLSELLRHAALPDGARLSGHTAIDCLALRLDLAHGVGSWRALALQTPLLSLHGSGGVNLADETLAMRLRAVASMGIGLAVPLDVAGTLRAPQVRVNIAGGAASALDGAAGLMIGRLGGDGAAAMGGPSCGSELATARGGWTGRTPAAAPAPSRPAAAPSRPAETGAKVFRWLLR